MLKESKMIKAWKIKSMILGASFAVAMGASTAAYAGSVCFTFINNSAMDVAIKAYDVDDAWMWVDLGPGITKIPAESQNDVCFTSVNKDVKIYYYASKAVTDSIKTSGALSGSNGKISGSASASYEGPRRMRLSGESQGMLRGSFGATNPIAMVN